MDKKPFSRRDIEYVSTAEACRILGGISARTLHRMRKDGLIPEPRNGRWYRRKDLDYAANARDVTEGMCALTQLAPVFTGKEESEVMRRTTIPRSDLAALGRVWRKTRKFRR